ncbi:22093_t:CDS:2 [Dentiscutata erythropus]|uniref:22093_t:CDS:1 n=1 Tax=Dentiscutata erythropus TaxID=1348616 RepID=A0A9N9HLS8_9GLOM|nr:22093_t:CDS:2 [Dentiscutata erythropus]
MSAVNSNSKTLTNLSTGSGISNSGGPTNNNAGKPINANFTIRPTGSPKPITKNNRFLKKPVPAHLIGNLPKHMRPKALAALPPQLPKGNLMLKKEYTITSSTLNKSKKLNIMRFHSSQPVDITKFTAPVKLQRRDPDVSPQQTLLLSRQNPIIPGPSKAPQQISAPAPTSGADASLIAPYAGARHNKKNLFKKKTTQIFLADDNQRKLKAEEKLPWVLEDYEGITWIGEYEGGDSAKYGGDKLEFVPIHRFYTFNPVVEGGIFDPKSTMKVVEGEEELIGSDEEARIPSREEYDEEEVDFEEVFEDDEEELPDDANPLIDDETKEVSKMKKKATSKHTYELSESDDDDKLTNEGKQLKKLLRTAENNDAYDSDREDNPYFSESDDSETEEPSSPQTKPPSTPNSKLDKASEKMRASDKAKAPSKAKVAKTKTASPKPKTVAKGKANAPLKQAPVDKVSSMPAASTSIPISSKIKPERHSSPIIETSSTQKSQSSAPTKNLGSKPKTVKAEVPVNDSKQSFNKVTVKKPVGSNQVTSINRTRSAESDSKSTISVKRPRALDATEQSTSAAAAKRVKTSDAKINKPRDIESSSITNGSISKRPRHDEPVTSNSATSASVTQNIKRSRPSDSKTSGVSTDAVKKAKTAQSTSTSGTPSRATVPSPSTNVGNDSRLITEGEIRKLIETKQVKVVDVIKAFKKRINEDGRNKDLLLNITKKIATYKGEYLVLKPQ